MPRPSPLSLRAAAWRIFLVTAGLFVVAGLALMLLGCSASSLQIQAHAASTLAAIADDVAFPALERVYEDEVVEALRALPAGATKGAEDAAVAAVRARWEPIWGPDGESGAWGALVASQHAWAAAIRQDDETAVLTAAAAARGAYCDLKRLVPRARLPELPLLPCEAPPKTSALGCSGPPLPCGRLEEICRPLVDSWADVRREGGPL